MFGIEKEFLSFMKISLGDLLGTDKQKTSFKTCDGYW